MSVRTPALALVLFVAFITVPIVAVAQTRPDNPDYDTQARSIVNALVNHHFDQVVADFNDSHSPALSAQRIANRWRQVTAGLGAFQKIESIQVANRRYHVATAICAFEDGALKITMYLDDQARIAGVRYSPAPGTGESSATPASAGWSAPEYADPKTFHEVPVTVADGQWQLPGTLTLPNGTGPFPAVVLLAGSGPADADETAGPNKTFKDLAWGLASHGVAVLRYPKRTHQYGVRSATDPAEMTVKDEYIDDARAAVAVLASRSEINPKRIFLAGHSEGAYLAPRIASGDAMIAGIILLEGPTRPIQQAALDQLHYLASLGGPNAAVINREIPAIEQQVKAIDDPNLKPGTMLPFLGTSVPSSYFLDLRGYDPAAVAATLTIPIDVIQGGRDYQVTRADFAAWEKALAGRANVTFKFYPSLNHLLIAGTGKPNPREYLEPGHHVSAEVVTDLASWIKGD